MRRSMTLKTALERAENARDNDQTTENPLSKVLCILVEYYYRLVKSE